MGRASRRKRTPVELVTSEPVIHPDATMGPDASFDGTGIGWIDRESTNAPSVGEDDASDTYAKSSPELLDKLLQQRVPLSARTVAVLIILAWFGFLSWLFLQDNQAGTLSTTAGLKWFAVKAAIFTIMTLVAGGMVGLAMKLLTGPHKAV